GTRKTLAGSEPQALAGDGSEHSRSVAVDGDHNVVKRRVRSVAVDPPWVVGLVLARVPAPRCQIEAARKRDDVVDDHYLLVMRSPRRGGVGLFVMHPPARPPSQDPT